MKSDTLEDTPSKKKMKQARLPFNVLTEPVPNSTGTRKRKLSADNYKESKVGRLSMENGASSKVNDTPKSAGNSSISENSDSTNELTPKQLQKKLEAAKRKEEREKEREEREKKKHEEREKEKEEKEKKRQEEKEMRAKLKQEKEDQKKREREEKEELKKKEREEKEELRKKEKEEKERQKELEKKLREEKEEQKRKEREEKEDQRRKEREAREEEKRKKQELLEQEKLEQQLKKKKAAEAFANFFVLKQKVDKETPIGPISKNSVLSSFTIKADMRLAPTVRIQLTDDKRKNLDECLEHQNVLEHLYFKCLKDGSVKPGRDGKTWPSSKDDDDIIIVEDELPAIEGVEEVLSSESVVREKLRPKLLSFKENRRPPYWGTWRKKSKFIKPRNPFGRDEKLLDYEVDSDEEWEEEEGESIDGSRCSDDDTGELDEYEVDNELFVPHGYLSDEEGTMDGEDNDMMSLSPETQKARLKHLEDEFETEMKKPTEKLKPRLFGPVWVNENGEKPENCVEPLWNYLQKYSMIISTDPTAFEIPKPQNNQVSTDTGKTKKKKNNEKNIPKKNKITNMLNKSK